MSSGSCRVAFGLVLLAAAGCASSPEPSPEAPEPVLAHTSLVAAGSEVELRLFSVNAIAGGHWVDGRAELPDDPERAFVLALRPVGERDMWNTADPWFQFRLAADAYTPGELELEALVVEATEERRFAFEGVPARGDQEFAMSPYTVAVREEDGGCEVDIVMDRGLASRRAEHVSDDFDLVWFGTSLDIRDATGFRLDTYRSAAQNQAMSITYRRSDKRDVVFPVTVRARVPDASVESEQRVRFTW